MIIEIDLCPRCVLGNKITRLICYMFGKQYWMILNANLELKIVRPQSFNLR